VKEVPIFTYYGDEISYVNALAYAWNVFRTIIRYRLHRAGLLYTRQFDLKGGYKYSFKPNRYSSHNRILGMLRAASRGRRWDVLDVGCGAGFLSFHIASVGHQVVGIDVYDSQEARKYCTQFLVADVEQTFGLSPDQKFDCIILADILEHTRNPEYVLLRARKHLKPGGRIITSTGNVANIYIRLKLLMGSFMYTERGILDRTHYRLFTHKSFIRLLRESGFRITQGKATPLPFDAVITGKPFISNILCFINMLGVWVSPSLFAYQHVMEAIPDSRATELLRQDEIFNSEYKEYL
jgi:2-polyprenyl-3-methyl-5-hydroxy-6-metoxy-1,4-benzoquinol methylase